MKPMRRFSRLVVAWVFWRSTARVWVWEASSLVVGALAVVGSMQGGARFVDCALGVVVALDGEAVLVDGAVALAGAVEDAGQLDVAPDLDPLGVAVAAEGVAEGVRGRLEVALHEKDFADAIGGQRAVFVGVRRFLVFDQIRNEFSLVDHLPSR